MTNIEEIWKDILGFEGLYQISNTGKVYSLPRDSGFRTKSRSYGQLMKPSKYFGYVRCLLNKEGVSSSFAVHRLVAKAFVPNPENKPFVNHKNGIRDDNRVENLEWCTSSENNTHSYRVLGKASPMTGRSGAENHTSKSVTATFPNGDKKKYVSMTIAAYDCGVSIAAVSKAARITFKSVKGIYFKLEE